MSALPPVGSTRLVAPVNTFGGVQLSVSAALQTPYQFDILTT